MAAAQQLLREAPDEALGMPDLVGAMRSIAYGEISAILEAEGRQEEAFLESVRAAWHWQQAIRLQRRLKEHPPSRAVEDLWESVERLSLQVKKRPFRTAVLEGLKSPDAEGCVQRVRSALGDTLGEANEHDS
jgi:hypothetical protein